MHRVNLFHYICYNNGQFILQNLKKNNFFFKIVYVKTEKMGKSESNVGFKKILK